MLGCAAVVNVPPSVVPETSVAETLPAPILPVTSSDVSVPTDVMLGCAAVVNEPPNVVPLTAPVTAKIFVAVSNVKFELAPKLQLLSDRYKSFRSW